MRLLHNSVPQSAPTIYGEQYSSLVTIRYRIFTAHAKLFTERSALFKYVPSSSSILKFYSIIHMVCMKIA